MIKFDKQNKLFITTYAVNPELQYLDFDNQFISYDTSIDSVEFTKVGRRLRRIATLIMLGLIVLTAVSTLF